MIKGVGIGGKLVGVVRRGARLRPGIKRGPYVWSVAVSALLRFLPLGFFCGRKSRRDASGTLCWLLCAEASVHVRIYACSFCYFGGV